MEFVSVRDLRLRPAEVWDKLRQQREVILTSNGRPVAVIADIREGEVEETLRALRRARAEAAASRLRKASVEGGQDRMAATEIEAEITQSRRERKTKSGRE